MSWSLDQIKIRLKEVKAKGFISIPPDLYRKDEGIVGQLLEREFGVQENNLSVRDLGEFELKGMRASSNTLTLCHKKPEVGLTPIQIFDRFGYVKPSRRDPSVQKKKLFTTIKGKKPNNLDLILMPNGNRRIDMLCKNESICQWDLEESLKKINNIILAFAETRGMTGSPSETFHYTKAYLLNGLHDLNKLVADGIVVIDFCIDQPVGSIKVPHDRGPHIRVPRRKLLAAYRDVKPILE